MHANGVYETTATTGTGTITLSAVTGSVRVSDVFGVGRIVSYAIKNGNNFEWGQGTVGASNTLARTYIMSTYVSGVYTTNGATAITLSGTSDVYISEHSGNWVGAGSAQKTGSDVYLFGHGVSAGNYATRALSSTTELNYTTFPILRPFLVKALGISVTTAGTASTGARLGLYASDTTGVPAKLLVDAGAVAIDTTGYKEATVTNFVLMPGQYWTAIIPESSVTVRGPAFTQMPGVAVGNTAATAVFAGLRSTGQTYGALSDPAPASSDQTNSTSALVFVKGQNI